MGILLDHPTRYTRDEDLVGLAWHLADLAGDDWSALARSTDPTARRRMVQLKTIAEWAQAAAVETKRHGQV